MSAYSGPEISEDGLAFAYDMSNTQKSWKGAPVNIAPYTDYSNRTYGIAYDVGGWGGDDADVYYYSSGGYNNLPYKKMIKHTSGTGGSYIDEHATFTIENNKTYKISCWMKANTAVDVSNLALCINRSVNNTYFGGSTISLTTAWTKKVWYWNSGSNGHSSYLGRHIVYNDIGLPIEVYWCDFKVEKISDSILDLTNTNTVLANSLTYSDNEFSFNGIDDYATIPITCNKTYYSINWWMFPNTRSSYNQWLSFNDAWNNWVFHTTTSGEIYIGTDVATRMTPTNLPANTLIANTWQNFTYTFDNGVGKFYKNGILLATKSGMTVSANTFTNFYVGSPSQGVNTINGKVASLGIYSNKVLSELEVKQNFNATRSRYGL